MPRKREAKTTAVQRQEVEEPEVLVRPPTKKRLEKIKEFFWDPKNKTCCTRTPLNWASIAVYYVAFLSVTLGIMFLTLYVVKILADQNPDSPRYAGDRSLLGPNPGVNFFPASVTKSPMIRVSRDRTSQDKIFREIEKNLNEDSRKEMNDCAKPPYGYLAGDESGPCIYLRINRVIGWKPVPFDSENLPDGFPEELKPWVKSGPGKIWVNCEGTYPKDRDRFRPEDFVFETAPGFEGKNFPYGKTNSYRDPIVVFRLKKNRDDSKKGILHSVTCTFWARNLRRKLEILVFFD